MIESQWKPPDPPVELRVERPYSDPRKGLLRCVLVDDDHENPDWLPDELCPDRGCPECGAAYARVLSVLVARPVVAVGSVTGRFVMPVEAPRPIRAVELACDSGHWVVYEPAPTWSQVLGIAAVVLGVGAYLLGRGACAV